MSAEARSRPSGWWWVLALGVVLGAAAGGTVAGQAAAQSTSTSAVLVLGTLTDGTADSALTSNQYVNQRMLTYPSIAVSDLVTQPAAQRLSLPPGELAGTITATVVPDATVIDLQVTGPTPEEAKRRNDAVTAALQAAITQTENLPGQPPRVQLSVVSQPSLPDPPAITPALGAALGAVLGALLGLVAMFGLARRHRAEELRRQAYDEELSREELARMDGPRLRPQPSLGPPPRRVPPPPAGGAGPPAPPAPQRGPAEGSTGNGAQPTERVDISRERQ